MKPLARYGIRARAIIAASAGMAIICALALGTAAASVSSGSLPPVAAADDWMAYLDGPLHYSYSPGETAITPANAGHLRQRWHSVQHRAFLATPTVFDHAVYVGSTAGYFYKLSVRTGGVLAERFIGYEPDRTCHPEGTVSTATVANNPVTGVPTVYVAGASGYLYALNASNLSVQWKSVVAIPSRKVNNYFTWSSPTVANGKIYIGVSSNCDFPQIRGGVAAYNQATGQRIASFYSVPRGHVGGSVWSSVAVAPDGVVFASTGNGDGVSDPAQLLGHSESVVKLNPDTLKLLGWYQIPEVSTTYDSDFGASPDIFGDKYVGACNKNGVFYMIDQSTMRVDWQERIGMRSRSAQTGACIAAPAYNGKFLYFGSNEVRIRGVIYPGSVQERLARNGKLIWETPLPSHVSGSAALDGAGVLTVPTYSFSPKLPDTLYLINARSGRILGALGKGNDFAQGVFAEGLLFTADTDGVYAWEPRRAG
jgi:outer membrane protein assembly factor BamB